VSLHGLRTGAFCASKGLTKLASAAWVSCCSAFCRTAVSNSKIRSVRLAGGEGGARRTRANRRLKHLVDVHDCRMVPVKFEGWVIRYRRLFARCAGVVRESDVKKV
jgi:hypothetical protein